ncbi:hypothetical protein Tco_0465354 [Tanacetum coccineum]
MDETCYNATRYYDYLYKPCPDQPPETATAEEKAAWKAEYKKHSDVACIMLGKMSPALQRQFENYPPQNMLAELRKMFEKPPAVRALRLVDTLHSCKALVNCNEHVLEMNRAHGPKHTLGKPYDNDMAVNLINRSLNKDFGDFVRNFNMHCVGKTVSDLHALLIDYEKEKGKGKADKAKQVEPFNPKPNPQKRKEKSNKGSSLSLTATCLGLEEELPSLSQELRANKKKLSIVLQGTCLIWQDCMQKLQREGLLESINEESLINANLVVLGR